MASPTASQLGVVAIGRNEGARLVRCLESVRAAGLAAVYVDSGSTDESIAAAEALGFPVVELDLSSPFTAARARDEGFHRLVAAAPSTEFVMFLDGDCELNPDWPPAAIRFLTEHPEVGVAAGRRRERHPEASVYNRLCDEEWDTPVGRAEAVGGDFVIRVDAYRQAGGFNASVPAGEEPELCHRVRADGWHVHRIDHEMTLHDAAMTRIGEWWKRQIRTGYGGYDVERRFGLRLFDRILKSALVWGLGAPVTAAVAAVLAAVFSGAVAGAAVLGAAAAIWLLQAFRIARSVSGDGRGWRRGLEYGWFTMLSKTPIALGAIKAAWSRLRNRPNRIIEYKSAEQASDAAAKSDTPALSRQS